MVGLDSNREYPIHFLDAKRQVGGTARVKAADATPTIRLEPCGEATARFVDSEGNPQVKVQADLHLRMPSLNRNSSEASERQPRRDEDFVANIDRINYRPAPKTDEEGRVTFPALIPGAEYYVSAYVNGERTQKTFKVQSGETVDLGEIVVKE